MKLNHATVRNRIDSEAGGSGARAVQFSDVLTLKVVKRNVSNTIRARGHQFFLKTTSFSFSKAAVGHNNLGQRMQTLQQTSYVRRVSGTNNRDVPSCPGISVNGGNTGGSCGGILQGSIHGNAQTLPPPTQYRRAYDLKSNAVRCMLKQRSEGDASAHVCLAQIKRTPSESSVRSSTAALSAEEWGRVFQKCCKSK